MLGVCMHMKMTHREDVLAHGGLIKNYDTRNMIIEPENAWLRSENHLLLEKVCGIKLLIGPINVF